MFVPHQIVFSFDKRNILLAASIKQAMATAQLIDAVAMFLVQVKDHPQYQDFRAQQFAKILLQIKGSSVNMESATKLLDSLKQIDWSHEESAKLQAEVANSIQLSVTCQGRKALQDYTALAAYLPAALWDDLLGSSLSGQAKLELLLMFGHKLGLSNPTESTMQFMCAVFLLSTEGQKALLLPPSVRLETLRMIKRVWKQFTSRAPMAILPHILKLPSCVQEFKDAYPAEFAKVFEIGPPAPCRLNWSDISICATGTPMRGRFMQVQAPLSMNGSLELQNVPALLQGLAQMYSSGIAFPQQAHLPMIAAPQQAQLPLTFLPGAQTRVQKKLDNRLQLPPSTVTHHASDHAPQALVAVDALPNAEAIETNQGADTSKDQRNDEEVPKPVKPLSVEAATQAVMKAMAAKSSSSAEKAAKEKKNAKKATDKCTAKSTGTSGPSKTVKKECKKEKKNEKKKEKVLPSVNQRMKLRPHGCSKCRGKPGCTPSCFK